MIEDLKELKYKLELVMAIGLFIAMAFKEDDLWFVADGILGFIFLSVREIKLHVDDKFEE